jgi:hypothetical protein
VEEQVGEDPPPLLCRVPTLPQIHLQPTRALAGEEMRGRGPGAAVRRVGCGHGGGALTEAEQIER